MSTNVSVRRRLFTLIFILAVCAWIPGCQLRIWSGWVPVSALPEWRNMYRPCQSFQVLLSTRNSGYEAQQLSECYKSEFSFDCWFHDTESKGNALFSLKNVPKVQWIPWDTCFLFKNKHCFSSSFLFLFFAFFSFKGIGHDSVLWECMIRLWQWGCIRLPLRSLPTLSVLR